MTSPFVDALIDDLDDPALDRLADRMADRLAERIARRMPTAQATKGYLDAEAAAEYLSCKPQRIYNLVSERRLPVFKDGSRSLFRLADLDALVKPGGRS